jgi:rhodanese-related sulfurtransferase
MDFKMRKKCLFGITVLLISAFMIVSCKTGSDKKMVSTEIKNKTGVELLMETLVKNGDYVNSRKFPSMIKAPTLYANLDSGTLVVDIRDPETFSKGHIKGAVNVQFPEIPSYFENKIKPFEFEKIVIVCYRGQSSSYTTCLLRLMGYGNVYSMRWGMTTWNPDLAGDRTWDKIISSKYTSKLETIENLLPAAGIYPDQIGRAHV